MLLFSTLGSIVGYCRAEPYDAVDVDDVSNIERRSRAGKFSKMTYHPDVKERLRRLEDLHVGTLASVARAVRASYLITIATRLERASYRTIARVW